jgi:hypothetical protein
MLTNLNLTDMEVGYKVFRAEALQQISIPSNRFGFEPEIAVKVAKLGYHVFEVPIVYHGRAYPEGKKIGWPGGVAAFLHIIPARFFEYACAAGRWRAEWTTTFGETALLSP